MARVAYLYCYRKRIIIGTIVLAMLILVLLVASNTFRMWVLGTQNIKPFTPTPSRKLESITRKALKAAGSYRHRRLRMKTETQGPAPHALGFLPE